MKKIKVELWYPKDVEIFVNTGLQPILYCNNPPNEDVIRQFFKTEVELPIEEEKITVEKSNFDYVIKKVKEKYPDNKIAVKSIVEELKKELGFNNDR